jgi:hypothetical protein
VWNGEWKSDGRGVVRWVKRIVKPSGLAERYRRFYSPPLNEVVGNYYNLKQPIKTLRSTPLRCSTWGINTPAYYTTV